MPRLVATFPTFRDAELRVGASYTAAGLQLEAPPDGGGRKGGAAATIQRTVPGRSMVGAALSAPWSVWRATVGYAAYVDSQSTLHDAELAVSVKPASMLAAWGAVRHRPFVELAEPLATDEQPFFSAGPGGASDLLGAWPLTVDELRVGGNLSPTSWSYAYADWRGMDVSDGNRGWTASGGAGASLTRVLGLGGPVDVTATWDVWAAAYEDASAVYYSPASVFTHSPGGLVRLRRAAFEVAAGGGVTFVPGQDFHGVFGAGAAILRLGRVSIAARGEARSDPWFASRKAWLAVQSEL